MQGDVEAEGDWGFLIALFTQRISTPLTSKHPLAILTPLALYKLEQTALIHPLPKHHRPLMTKMPDPLIFIRPSHTIHTEIHVA